MAGRVVYASSGVTQLNPETWFCR